MKFLKDFKAIIFFIVALLVLSALSFWDESKTKKESQEEKVKNRIVDSSLSIKDVAKVSIFIGSDGKNFDIIKEENAWKLHSDVVNEAADPMVVDGFIEGVFETKYNKDLGEVVEETKLKDYGLNVDSNYKLSLGFLDDRSIDFSLGGTTPMDEESYLKVGSKVYVVSEYVKKAIEKDLTFFRDKRVIKIDESRVKGLSFIYNKRTIDFSKEEDTYKIKGSSIDVDQNKVKDIIRGLNDNFVSSFIDKPSTIQKKLNKFLDLFVKDIEDKEIKISFYEYDQKVYFKFKGREIIYESSYALKNLLTKDPKDFEVKKEEAKKEDIKEHNDHEHNHNH